MPKSINKINTRERRRKRIRSKISGTQKVPRLSIYRSNKFLYGQLIDDEKGVTIVASSDMGLKEKTKTLRSKEAGKILAKNAVSKKVKKIVFDRGGFSYTGRVKAFAEGAREGGLEF